MASSSAAAGGNDVELDNFHDNEWNAHSHELQSLPRADGGKQAWLFLTGCFLLEALVWGTIPPFFIISLRN